MDYFIIFSKKALNKCEPFFALTATQQIEGTCGGNPVYPGGELRLSLKGMYGPVNLYEDFLGYIFGVLFILNNTDNSIINPVLKIIDQPFKGLLVLVSQLLYQIQFVQ